LDVAVVLMRGGHTHRLRRRGRPADFVSVPRTLTGHHTLDAVGKMLTECAQVIVLEHDAHFLRELKRIVSRKKLGNIGELTLRRDAQDYSYLSSFDLDDYCSSEYYKHCTRVERFVNAEPDCKLVEVAQSLRFLVEGHMHTLSAPK